MFKKTFLVSVAALSLSAGAFAHCSDNLANCSDNGDENLPAMAPIAVMVESNFAPNIYVALQAGYGMSGWKDLDGFDAMTVGNNAGLSGRLSFGYAFHKNFGVELGGLFLSNRPDIYDAADFKIGSIRTEVVDLIGKLNVPVNDTVDIYAKAGAGYIMSSNDVGGKGKLNTFCPALGVGMSFNLGQYMFADISWMHYNGDHSLGNSSGFPNKYQPSVDFFGVGIGAKFNFT